MEEKLILEMLDSPYVETRLLAVEFLLKAVAPSPAAIVKAMEDEALLVREQAALLAARHLAPERLIGLVGNHGNAILRNSAIEALKRGKERERKALLAALSNPDDEVVMFSAQILGDLPGPIEAGPLLALLSHADPNIAQAGIEALGKHKCREAVPRLLEALTCEFWLQFAAIAALGEIGDRRAIPKLLSLLEDEFCQMEALEALGKIGDPETVEPLVYCWQRTERLLLRDRLTLSVAQICQEEPKVKLTALLRQYLTTPEVQTRAAHYLYGALGSLAGEGQTSVPALSLRRAAVYWLVRLPETPNLELLVEQLRDPELESALNDGFSLLGAKAFAALRAGLTSEESEVRRKAARLSAELGNSEALEELTRLLRDPFLEVQVAGIEALGALGDAGGLAALLPLLSSGEAELCDTAAQALAKMPREILRPALVRFLEEAPPSAWGAGLEVVALVPSTAFVPFIQRGLAAQEPSLARAAIRAAMRSPEIDLLAEVGPLVEHPSSLVRVQAIDALGMSNKPSAAELLFGRLRGPEAERYFVVRALGDLKSVVAVSVILSLFDEFDPRTRLAALEALGKIGGSEAEGFLVRCVEGSFGEERRAAAAALAACNVASYEDRFVALVQDPDWRLRSIAAFALGRSSSEAAQKALRALVRDPESIVARAALSALAQTGQSPKGQLR